MTDLREALRNAVVTGEPKCKGIYVRYHSNVYFSRGAFNKNHRLQILTKLSCKLDHDGNCEMAQFNEDIHSVGAEDLGLEAHWSKLKENQIYRLRLILDPPDWETGYVDSWWWELKEAD